jgi:uncharacterized protein (DUF1330 family)
MADAAHKRFGSKLLARGGRREVVEGHNAGAQRAARVQLLSTRRMRFYHGPEYSRAIRCASRTRSAIS